MISPSISTALTRVKSGVSAAKMLFETLADAVMPGWDEFARHVQSVQVMAGSTVFHQGAEHPFVHVVRLGLIKNVYVRVEGEMWIKSFTSEGRFIASIAALKAGGCASFSAICIEDCELERIPFDVIELFARRDLVWANMLRKAITIFAERKEQRERELLVLSAEERYRALMAEQSDLERRVSQKDIAAYIGVTPVGLNRIIKRVRG